MPVKKIFKVTAHVAAIAFGTIVTAHGVSAQHIGTQSPVVSSYPNTDSSGTSCLENTIEFYCTPSVVVGPPLTPGGPPQFSPSDNTWTVTFQSLSPDPVTGSIVTYSAVKDGVGGNVIVTMPVGIAYGFGQQYRVTVTSHANPSVTWTSLFYTVPEANDYEITMKNNEIDIQMGSDWYNNGAHKYLALLEPATQAILVSPAATNAGFGVWDMGLSSLQADHTYKILQTSTNSPMLSDFSTSPNVKTLAFP